MELIEVIRQMIAEKKANNERPLNIGVIELCERLCKPYDEIRSDLNKLCKMGLIKAINRVNNKTIELI